MGFTTIVDGEKITFQPDVERQKLKIDCGRLPCPSDEGFGLGQKVRITAVVDQKRCSEYDPRAVYQRGGPVLQTGIGEVAEIVGIEVRADGSPDDLLDGTMLVKLPDGQLLIVLPDEVEHETP